jgi:predicted permease
MSNMKYEQLEVCVLQRAMPMAVLVTIFSVKYDADPFFCSAVVSLTTLVSMGSIPVLVFLLKRAIHHGSPFLPGKGNIQIF